MSRAFMLLWDGGALIARFFLRGLGSLATRVATRWKTLSFLGLVADAVIIMDIAMLAIDCILGRGDSGMVRQEVKEMSDDGVNVDAAKERLKQSAQKVQENEKFQRLFKSIAGWFSAVVALFALRGTMNSVPTPNKDIILRPLPAAPPGAVVKSAEHGVSLWSVSRNQEVKTISSKWRVLALLTIFAEFLYEFGDEMLEWLITNFEQYGEYAWNAFNNLGHAPSASAVNVSSDKLNPDEEMFGATTTEGHDSVASEDSELFTGRVPPGSAPGSVAPRYGFTLSDAMGRNGYSVFNPNQVRTDAIGAERPEDDIAMILGLTSEEAARVLFAVATIIDEAEGGNRVRQCVIRRIFGDQIPEFQKSH